jgi:beta-lactamase superfamily II metal-dependent hydrolase
MQIDIFDVEHGSCALISTDNNKHILMDAGHNTTTGWRPSTYLPAVGIHGLDALMITNYDEDHASDLHNLIEDVSVKTLYRNKGVTAGELKNLKGTDAGPGIEALMDMMGRYTAPVPQEDEDYGGISFEFFRHAYPTFEDENNLSLVAILKYHGLGICFPGDMEEDGWNALIDRNPALLEAMKGVNIFIASHHGRENGCCERLYKNWKPYITLISDSGIEYATQETIAWYRERSLGMDYDGQKRFVFTTRSDGGMRIIATPDGKVDFEAGIDHSIPKKKALNWL